MKTNHPVKMTLNKDHDGCYSLDISIKGNERVLTLYEAVYEKAKNLELLGGDILPNHHLLVVPESLPTPISKYEILRLG